MRRTGLQYPRRQKVGMMIWSLIERDERESEGDREQVKSLERSTSLGLSHKRKQDKRGNEEADWLGYKHFSRLSLFLFQSE